MKLTHEELNQKFEACDYYTKLSIIFFLAELERAKELHPKWVADKDGQVDLIHAAAVVSEEAGELIQATLEFRYERGNLSKVFLEAMHTGAMALRFLTENPEFWYSSLEEKEATNG